jgi:hypothetical protein
LSFGIQEAEFTKKTRKAKQMCIFRSFKFFRFKYICKCRESNSQNVIRFSMFGTVPHKYVTMSDAIDNSQKNYKSVAIGNV